MSRQRAEGLLSEHKSSSRDQAVITLKRGPLRTAEIWFQEDAGVPADIVHLHLDRRLENQRYRPEYTIEVDLTRSPDDLLSAISRSTRRDIRRAEREGACCHFWLAPAENAVQEFQLVCQEFFRSKRLNSPSRSRLQALQRSRVLAITNAASNCGRVLAWHSYVCAGDRAVLLNSVSLYRSCATSAERNAVARANRYLHYQDILAFKSAGFHIYDFGGWYPGNSNSDLIGINQFKAQFGGQIKAHFHYERGVSLLGKCVLMLKHALQTLL